jgi:hypothetical protein
VGLRQTLPDLLQLLLHVILQEFGWG